MSNVTKIVFLLEHPFGRRDYERFGIEILQQNGFAVQVWDFTPFLNPNVYYNFQITDTVVFEGYKLFFNWNEAIHAISSLNKHYFVVNLVGYKYHSFEIYRMFTKYKLNYCVFVANCLPDYTLSSKIDIFSKLKKITHLLDSAKRKMIFNAIFRRIPFAYLGVKPATTVLLGGEKSASNYSYPIDKTTDRLWIHTLDYDIYLAEKEDSETDKTKGVFLDEYYPFHPDYLHLGIPPPVTAEEYYPLLCNFFDYLETNHALEITIAAHPRSCYENHPDYFEGRSVIRGQTVQLVKQASVVLLHSSTAVNFSVLFRKPMIFMTSDKLEKGMSGKLIDQMSRVFGKSAIRLDGFLPFDWSQEFVVNEMLYSSYQQLFIKKDDSKQLPFWRIVADYLKQYN